MTNLSKLITTVLILTLSNNTYCMENYNLDKQINNNALEDNNNEDKVLKYGNIKDLKDALLSSDIDVSTQHAVIEENLYNIIKNKAAIDDILKYIKDKEFIRNLNVIFQEIFVSRNMFPIPFGVPITEYYYFDDMQYDANISNYEILKECNQEITTANNEMFEIIEYINQNKDKFEKQGEDGKTLYNNLIKFFQKNYEELLDNNIIKTVQTSYNKRHQEILIHWEQILASYVNKHKEYGDLQWQIQQVLQLKCQAAFREKTEKLFKNSSITIDEYNQRIKECNNNNKKLDFYTELQKLVKQLKNNGFSDVSEGMLKDSLLEYRQIVLIRAAKNIMEFFDRILSDKEILDKIFVDKNAEEFISLIHKMFLNVSVDDYNWKPHMLFTILQIKKEFNNLISKTDNIIRNNDKCDQNGKLQCYLTTNYYFMLDDYFEDLPLGKLEKYLSKRIKAVVQIFDNLITKISNSNYDDKSRVCDTLIYHKKNTIQYYNDELDLLKSSPILFYFKYSKNLSNF